MVTSLPHYALYVRIYCIIHCEVHMRAETRVSLEWRRVWSGVVAVLPTAITAFISVIQFNYTRIVSTPTAAFPFRF